MSQQTLIQSDITQWLTDPANVSYPKAHAVFGDPPYNISFMSKNWDTHESPKAFQSWVTEWASLLLDYVYPGAILAMFGGTRTYHRLACGLEDAGWEIFDSLACWIHAQGFPKAADISKLIDKAANAEREVVGQSERGSGASPQKLLSHAHGDTGIGYLDGSGKTFDLTAPATDAAKRWDGYKSALKPSFEPVVLARAPRLKYTYAQLAEQFGTGALNIDGSRVGTESRVNQAIQLGSRGIYGDMQRNESFTIAEGRFPANTMFVCECEGDQHDAQCPIFILDQQSGQSKSSGGIIKRSGGFARLLEGRTDKPDVIPDGYRYADKGGVSRFFFQAKASAWEREAGLDAFEEQLSSSMSGRRDAHGMSNSKIDGDVTARFVTSRRNIHPTLKPIQLCEAICRLLLPPELNEPRHILIPFSGSGSECIGAHLAGWDKITGIEQDGEYIKISQARLRWWSGFDSYDQAKTSYGVKETVKDKDVKVVQTALF